MRTDVSIADFSLSLLTHLGLGRLDLEEDPDEEHHDGREGLRVGWDDQERASRA